MVVNSLNNASVSARYSACVSTFRIRPRLSRTYCPFTISGTPQPFCTANQTRCAMAISESNQEQGATQLGMPRANPFQQKLGVLDRGYSRTYIGTRSAIHPGISKRSPHNKILSTDVPEKLYM